MISKKWDLRFLDMADVYASWSKDPSSQIGAVVVDTRSRRILSGGYNGFPRGILDSSKRLKDREEKYKYIVHAEKNAIYNATWAGISLDGSTLYLSGLPICHHCAPGIIQVGIRRVVMRAKKDERWQDSWELARDMLNEVGIKYKFYSV